MYPIGIPVGKFGKKQSEGVHFFSFGTQNTVPNCQKYTPTDCIFGDFVINLYS